MARCRQENLLSKCPEIWHKQTDGSPVVEPCGTRVLANSWAGLQMASSTFRVFDKSLAGAFTTQSACGIIRTFSTTCDHH